jgi:hypothetical protein
MKQKVVALFLILVMATSALTVAGLATTTDGGGSHDAAHDAHLYT